MNKVTRYWVNGTEILSGNGVLKENGDFVFDDGLGQRTIFKGYHFGSKYEAFEDYYEKVHKKMDKMLDDVEVLRKQL